MIRLGATVFAAVLCALVVGFIALTVLLYPDVLARGFARGLAEGQATAQAR